jgi:hypothetical protein
MLAYSASHGVHRTIREQRSSFDLFRRSLQTTMTKHIDLDTYLQMNLIGTPR